MNRKNITPGILVEGSVSSTDISSDEINQLKAQMQDMQLEIDILKATINVKKRPRHRSEYSHQRREDSDNRCLEKQILTAIITKITIIKNDYYYQKQKEDKYTLLRVRVIELYTENRG